MNKNSLLFLVVLLVAGFLGYKYFIAGDAGNQTKENLVTFHRNHGGEPEDFKSINADNTWESALFRDICEPLMSFGPIGELVPGGAERYEVSNDGLTYTFHLRKNAKWSNGDPVIAADYVKAYQMVVDPAQAVKFAWILENVVNAKEITAGKEKDVTKLAAKALDDHTVQFQLTNPTPYFVDLHSHSCLCPVPTKYMEKVGDDWSKPEKLVTNGSYRMVEWQPQQHIKIEKNPHFHSADDVFVDVIFHHGFDDNNAVLRQYLAGEMDYVEDVPLEKISSLEEKHPEHILKTMSLTSYYYAINAQDERFKDSRVRKALSLAIDRENIAYKILKKGRIPAYQLVPDNITEYYRPYQASYKDMPYAERVEEAKRLLKEAGYGPDNPLEFELTYNTSENHEKIAVAIQSMWKTQLGVNAVLSNSDANVHYDNLQNGKFDIGRAGWAADYADAQDYLLLMAEGNNYNYGKYFNEEFQKLYDKSFHITDLKERDEVLRQAEKIAIEDTAIIPLFLYEEYFLFNPKFTGWKVPNPKRAFLSRYLRLK